MKRIVFAVTNDLSYDRRMQRVCETLQLSGYEVELIGRKRKHSIALDSRPFSQRRLKCFFDKGPMFYVEYNLRLFFLLLGCRADIFGACDLDTALAVCMAASVKKKPSVFDAHEHFPEVPEVERRKRVKRIWQRIGHWAVPKFHERYTVGEALAQILHEEYRVPFSVVRNLPSCTDNDILPAEKRKKVIVYLGALNEGRGLEHAIKAMQLLQEFRLRLVGEGDLSDVLRQQVKELGLTDRVEFTGMVTPESIEPYLADAMIGLNVLESRSKSYYYSLANKFFDYLQAGVPSLNMRFPEYEKILDQYHVGLCIETLSAEAIADAVKRIANNSQSYAQMVDTCRSARDNFCWQQEEVKLNEIFARLGS